MKQQRPDEETYNTPSEITPRMTTDNQPRWTFLSNYAHVLICLAQDSEIRIRDIAALTGITERAVMKILGDLEGEGLIRRHREGRRNHYQLLIDRPLRHPLEAHREVGELISLILERPDRSAASGE